MSILGTPVIWADESRFGENISTALVLKHHLLYDRCEVVLSFFPLLISILLFSFYLFSIAIFLTWKILKYES